VKSHVGLRNIATSIDEVGELELEGMDESELGATVRSQYPH
jgi:hypothetical protein